MFVGFEDRILVLIVPVPVHCLPLYFGGNGLRSHLPISKAVTSVFIYPD